MKKFRYTFKRAGKLIDRAAAGKGGTPSAMRSRTVSCFRRPRPPRSASPSAPGRPPRRGRRNRKAYSPRAARTPFYGKHYAKHVEHALKFLKPDGVLYAVLPVTARTDHGEIDKMGLKCKWSDLPVGAFRESGTNINTTLLTMYMVWS